jgi:hypothetical protein
MPAFIRRKVWVLPDAWASAKTFHDPHWRMAKSFAVKRGNREQLRFRSRREYLLELQT